VLVIETAARGVATVTLVPDPAVGVPGGVRTERRCNELQLDAGRFRDEDVLRFVAGKPAPARQKGAATVLRADVDTKLAPAPGQPQVASLRPRDDAMRAVDVIERRGREARIFWRRDGYAVFGWVPAAAVKAPAGDEPASMWGTLGAPPQRAVVANTRCGNDLPLLVEMAGRRFEVGVVRKGASFAVGAKRDGFVGIELAGGPVELDPGAAWIVREADFARACGGR
jgi:hypothetical protein